MSARGVVPVVRLPLDGHDCPFEAIITGALTELRSRDDLRRKKGIHLLRQYINQDMSDVSDDELNSFYDLSKTKIFDLMLGSGANNANDIKAGIVLMCILLDSMSSLVDKAKPVIYAPFANHLRNLNHNFSDMELLDLSACAVGKIAINSGAVITNFVDFEIRRAIENLSPDKNEIKRHSAVLNLRELANVTPTYFFSQVNLFFENIFLTINDPKIRDSAVSALRSALYVVAERERISHDLKDNKSRIDQQIPKCFKICFE
ncbi:unnamed protein product, partial [Medioppia subpectinata]